ncbi:MAG: T6SS immunity protein Tli4 family protein, partial [Caldimonas sp.]|uniref:T6SS immunity protein Tli4 family protein n=1 Tax=Caldimonas sp. TaxID=2838790 RepID=UPI0039187BB5
RPNRNNVEEKYTHLLNVYGRLRGRSDEEIPSEPGDCFAHGFLRGGPLEDVDITTFYHLQDAPDVFVMFSHSTQVWEDDTMLQRSHSIERQLAAAGIKTLRKGPRTIHGLPYEEWLSREPETVTSARVPGHGLTLHGNEAAKDPRKPNIEFTFYNGHYIPWPPRSLEEAAKVPDLTRATLSEGQVLALWEAITATLRPRPGAL